MGEIIFGTVTTSLGELRVAVSSEGVREIRFPREGAVDESDGWTPGECELLATTRNQLIEYFARQRTRFDLPLDLQGTDFQRRVWSALVDIPYGDTISYGELARRIDRPSASRAVGAANGRNPVPIVVPCHRVIGSNGALTGFGGGLDLKVKLLALESPLFGR